MSVTLEFNLKDGKSAIKAIVTEGAAELALAEYEKLQTRFPGGAPTTTSRVKKADSSAEQPESAEPAAAQNVVNINQQPNARTAKKLFAQQAINLNEEVLLWAGRMAAAIKEFNGLEPQQLAEKLNFRKPIAMLEVPELQELLGLMRTTLQTYSANNADVKAFMKIIGAIDTLQSGSEEEWEAAKVEAGIGGEDWAFLGQNKSLFEFCHKQLTDRRHLLQVAAAAAEAV